MPKVLVVGAGKIGALVATLLSQQSDYQIYIVDIDFKFFDSEVEKSHQSKLHKTVVDVSNEAALAQYLQQQPLDAMIACIPFYSHAPVAKLAKQFKLHYFDLTEDVQVTELIQDLAKGQPQTFVGQCGLAPGFISIVAHHHVKHFDKVEDVLLRVGALPLNPHNTLKYALTWSTDGLINEYGNLCNSIVNGTRQQLQPLEGLETIEIQGKLYEAFNTSGGLGSLVNTYLGKVDNLNYKTIRYPGHCQYMHFLMVDLNLNEDRKTLKQILENAIPRTFEDVVLIYVAIKGEKNGELIEETYFKEIYPQKIAGKLWTAIQVATASSACAVMDIVLHDPKRYQGIVLQEQIRYEDFINNRFGRYYLDH